jgi:hypothetical protein
MKKLINYLLENQYEDLDQHDDPESEMIVRENGEIEYRHKQTGKLHNKFGWAIKNRYEDKSWYKYGQLHREDGPAITYEDGTQLWYLNGKRHKEDGPAIIWSNKRKSYYLNDKKYSESEFYKKQYKHCRKNPETLEDIKKFIKNNLWILKYFKKLPKELQEFEDEYYKAKLGYYNDEEIN